MLRRCVLSAVLGTLALTGCRETLESPPEGGVCEISTTDACKAADGQSSLAWIEENIFAKQCAFSGCHNATSSAAGRLDLKNPGKSHAALVDVASAIEPSRKLVVPGAPQESYLLMLLQAYPPAEMEPTPASPPPDDVGFMPQNAPPICCQKLDAVERWIAEGAMNN